MAAGFIKKIDMIKGFGSFESYSWPTDLPDFRKKNLVYGRNGSGKTTLSCFLQCFENQEFPDDFIPSPTMQVTTSSGKSDELSALHSKIKVFNVYYIESNFEWDDGQANNLLWLGKEDIETQKKIKELESSVESGQSNESELKARRDKAKKELDEMLISHSLTIRTNLNYGQSKYKKNNLESDYEKVILGEIVMNALTQDEYIKKRPTAIAQSSGSSVDLVTTPQINLTAKVQETLSLISEKITPTNQIKELMESPALKEWVSSGLDLHDRKPSGCQFCKDGNLTQDRIDELGRFFDKKQQEFTRSLQVKKIELEALIQSIKQLKTESVELSPEQKQRNDELAVNFRDTQKEILSLLHVLLLALSEKEKDLYSNHVTRHEEISKLDYQSLEEGLTKIVVALNQVREEHNRHVKNFANIQKSTCRELELHLASEKKDEYCRLRAHSQEQESDYKALLTLIKTQQDEIVALKAEISSSDIAAHHITETLKLMGHGHIKLSYDPKERSYHLLRGGKNAKRLSEGEKTAISFAHFIASLKEESFDLANSVVVIDDPISSMDSTASFFVYGLIKELIEKAGQLFVMTHSHSFFTLLVEDFRNYKEDQMCYEVVRVSPEGSDVGHSRIKAMEQQKTVYYSEYSYIFTLIFTAAEEIKVGTDISYDNLFNLMNCCRKLLEGFLGFKFPSEGKLKPRYEQAAKANEISPAMRAALYKVINFGSHSGIDSMLVGSGLTSEEIRECVPITLEFMNKVDKEHYDGMVKCAPLKPTQKIAAVA